MSDLETHLKCGPFQIPLNRRVYLMTRQANFADCLVLGLEGTGDHEILIAEVRSTFGTRNRIMLYVEDIRVVEYTLP